jgi:hypothetical protein
MARYIWGRTLQRRRRDDDLELLQYLGMVLIEVTLNFSIGYHFVR